MVSCDDLELAIDSIGCVVSFFFVVIMHECTICPNPNVRPSVYSEYVCVKLLRQRIWRAGRVRPFQIDTHRVESYGTIACPPS